MTAPLNFTAKAIEQLSAMRGAAPGVAQGFAYIVEKMKRAQVFVLPDYGTLLDRGAARPDLPGEMFRPPFPVVALEYTAQGPSGRVDGIYTAAPSSRRIALAFEWINDLPPALARMSPVRRFLPGVVIVSIFYSDEHQIWLPVAAAFHFAYDDLARRQHLPSTPFRDAMIAAGRISKAAQKAGPIAGTLVPIMPEGLAAMASAHGPAALFDSLQADLMDEVNAYFDLCAALGCRNVRADRQAAPARLNKVRARAGRLPLPDIHVLTLGDAVFGGDATGGGAGRRGHLRRGHIRRLGPERITWVNQTMVRGSGFAEKIYSVGC